MKRKADDDLAEALVRSKRNAAQEKFKQNFRVDLFEPQMVRSFREAYGRSKPYKHGVIDNLIKPALLRSVRDEIQTNISFTPKETDIYRIHQSGDLANLDGLDDSSLSLLPSLVTLRDSLYSDPFRTYLANVTGSGPLSGRKTDMAVNIYTPGCHLLCHDDVIGSRRVSYILYLTDPDKSWRKEWGGALRLYPTEEKVDSSGKTVKVPHHEHTKTIPPAFGQLSFFAVQPGESYHDVEEVYAPGNGGDEGDEHGGRVRMAISGWYHVPQKGEDGYVERAEEAQAERSSLAQLEGNSDEFEQPREVWFNPENEMTADGEEEEEDPGYNHIADKSDLTESDLDSLLLWMNPRYLVPDTVAELAENFANDSEIRLERLLNDKRANRVRVQIEKIENLGASRKSPPSLEPRPHWQTATPPHKHRFQYSQVTPYTQHMTEAYQGCENPYVQDDVMVLLANDFFADLPFRKWLALATGLSLTQCSLLARRFRRGMDYTLATAYEHAEPQLEMCLGLTPTDGWVGDDEDEEQDEDEDEMNDEALPSTNGASGRAAAKRRHDGSKKALSTKDGSLPPPKTPESSSQQPNVGGYEVYMASDDNDAASDRGSDRGVDVPTNVSSHTGAGKRRKADPAVYKQAGEDEEDDGVLLSAPASWNTLSLVLRDQGTLKFVKYVSQTAKGDRWDISGAWKVVDEDDGSVEST